MNREKAKVIFLRAADNTSKLEQICKTVNLHFEKNERMQISVPSTDAAAYVDQLLWRLPEESFIPHSISQSPTQEQIIITTQTGNLNHATIWMNLCPAVSGDPSLFSIIYELWDQTHPSKEALSAQRQAFYRLHGHSIEVI
jgi:DNA polymerase III subunit chi